MIDTLNSEIGFIPVKLSRNELMHVIEPADTALTSRVGLKYALEILVPEFDGSGSFVALHRSQLREKPPYQIGDATIYEGAAVIYNKRNGKLDNLLELKKPDYGMLEPAVITTQAKQYKLRELVTGGTPAVDIDVTGSTNWVVKAGLNEADYLAYSATLFSSEQMVSRRFLTSLPSRKIVSVNQTEYLSFLMNINPMPSAVRLRIECSGAGRVLSTNSYQVLSGMPFMGVVMFPVNFKNLGLPSNCSSFKVWLSDSANARLSEVRTYEVDKIKRKNERFILYSNSLGGWDTLRLIGEATETAKVSQTTMTKDKSAFDALQGEVLHVIGTEGDREISVSTGYVQKDIKQNVAALEELLVSENIYLETPKGHKQLKRLTNTMVVAADEFGNEARTLQFSFVDPVRNFSTMAAVSPAKPRATYWAAFGNQRHVLNANGKRTGYRISESLIKKYVDDDSIYKPTSIKANVAGTDGYIDSYLDPAVTVGSTPYPNAVVNTFTTYKRNNCGVGFEGGYAPIVIAANTYGGEQPGDAAALATAAVAALNSQAYANANGPCNIAGPSYSATVPANHFHYRYNQANLVSLYYVYVNESFVVGNDSRASDTNTGPYAYAFGSNGLNFPVSGWNILLNWKIRPYGFATGANKTLKCYRNGVLMFSVAITITNSASDEVYAFANAALSIQVMPANGDKFFWECV
jgi:hypothetical protein